MIKKRFIALMVLVAVVAFSLFVYPFFVYGVSLVDVKSEGTDVQCYLQWSGKDQTPITVTILADFGRQAQEYTKILDNGAVFAVPISANHSWAEVSYYDKTVSLHYIGDEVKLVS